MTRRPMRRALAALAVAVGLDCQAAFAEQPDPAFTALQAVARALTERDPAVRTLDVRGRYVLPPGPVRFQFKYDSSQGYSLYLALEDPEATIFAADAHRVVRYDVEQGYALVERDAVPFINLTADSDALLLKWGSEPRAATRGRSSFPVLFIDFPALLQSAGDHPQVTSVGGQQQFVFREKNGTILSIRMDRSGGFPFTGLKIEQHGQRLVEVEIRANITPVRSDSIPDMTMLRRTLDAQDMAALEDVPAVIRTAVLQFLPVAAGDVQGGEFRRALESLSGRKYDWALVQANLRRDTPKMRAMLSVPDAPETHHPQSVRIRAAAQQ